MQSWLSLLLLSSLTLGACKDALQAKCTVDTFKWAFNSINHGPCRVASNLNKVCNAPIFEQLPQDAVMYAGPSSQSSCMCNLVQYNLLRVCSMCQGKSTENQDVQNFKEWAAGCDSQTVVEFPGGSPQGEMIPVWAYQGDVAGNFDLDTLEKAAVAPAAPPSGSAVQVASSWVNSSRLSSSSFPSTVGYLTSASSEAAFYIQSSRTRLSDLDSSSTPLRYAASRTRSSSTQSSSTAIRAVYESAASESAFNTNKGMNRVSAARQSVTDEPQDNNADPSISAVGTFSSRLSSTQLSSAGSSRRIASPAGSVLETKQADSSPATSERHSSTIALATSASLRPVNADEVMGLSSLAEGSGFDWHPTKMDRGVVPPTRIATIAGSICGAVALAGFSAGLLLWQRRKPRKDCDEISFISRPEPKEDTKTISIESAYDSGQYHDDRATLPKLAAIGALAQSLLTRVRRHQTIESFLGGHAPRETVQIAPPLPSIPKQYMTEAHESSLRHHGSVQPQKQGPNFYGTNCIHTQNPNQAVEQYFHKSFASYPAHYRPSVSPRDLDEYGSSRLGPFALEAQNQPAYGNHQPHVYADACAHTHSYPQSLRPDDGAVSHYSSSTSFSSEVSQLPPLIASGIPIHFIVGKGPAINLHPASAQISRQSAATTVQRKKHWI